MISSRKTQLAGAALLALCGLAQGHDDAARAPERPRIERAMEAFGTLEAAHPGVRRYVEDGTISMVYGAPMTQGATAMEAAVAWLDEHSGVFGAGELELTLNEEVHLKDGTFTAYLFTQTIEGIPVDGGIGRILVRNDIEKPTVVYGAGRLADRPADAGAVGAGDFAAAPVDPAQALQRVQRTPGYDRLANWSDPELIWHYGDVGAERPVAQLAWAFNGWSHTGPDGPEGYRFFIDASTGALIEARWNVHDIDVDGRVQANAHTTLSPIGPMGPVDVPAVDVRIMGGGGSAVTENDGTFVIPHPGTSFVNVATAVQGPWVTIVNQQGDTITASVGVTPPGPAELMLNQAPTEFTTAQVNALIGVGATHNFVTDRAIGFQALDHQVITRVNDGTGSCNAFFMPGDESLTFYREGGGCVNAAYSTVVTHEYGHFVVHRLGLLQGPFGEGYSDSLAVMLWDTGIIAPDFFGPGAPIRDLTLDPPLFKFPCIDPIPHNCGQVLGGSWWRIRQNFGATHGVTDGLEMARELFVGWSMITLGVSGFDAAHPRTVVEALTIDDDDWYIENGTPNWDEIVGAFAFYDIQPPALEFLSFQFPQGLPDLLTPGAETEVRVQVEGLRADWQPASGTGQLFVSIDGRPPVSSPLEVISGTLYRATLPAIDAMHTMEYYFRHGARRGTQQRTSTWPPDAPAKAITAIAGYPVAKDNFETDTGWTVTSRDLISGEWERGVPLGWGANGEPPRDFDGSGKAFVTENLAGDHDVDGGPTRLLSPVYDLSEFGGVHISYARWFYNDDRDIDRMTIEMSSNGGISWTPIEVLSHQDGWQLRMWRVPSPETIPTLTDRFRMRISISDDPDNSVTEGGFDRFWILSSVATCRADLDGDGELSFFDFLAFQNLFAAGDPQADFDGDGDLTFFDFLAFQNEFAAGCP